VSTAAPVTRTHDRPTGHARPDRKTVALTREVPAGRRPGWWGMALFLVTDASSFAALIAGYYYLEFVTSRQWPPPGDPLPKLVKASIITGIIVLSCVPLAVADLGLKRGSRVRAGLGVLLTALCGLAFIAIECWEISDELASSTPQKDAYGSMFYVLLGYHLLHVMVGAAFLLLLAVAAAAGRLTARHHVTVRVFSMFWYTSAAIWVLLYLVLYWSVRL